MQRTSRVAVVTGGNRGLGLETCRQLARHGLEVVMTSRDRTKGVVAVDQLRAQGLQLHCEGLDVTDEHSIVNLVEKLERRFGRVDVLVNNAGVFLDSTERGASVLQVTHALLTESMETNLYGPLRVCQALVPMMRRHKYGRIVNVSSGMGQLSEMAGHWPGYRLSKAALNALTRILAAELDRSQILVNSVCPGWVRTDMGGSNADRSVQEGADTIVWAATLPAGGPTGGFFRDREPLAW